jgi:hypothetical protein
MRDFKNLLRFWTDTTDKKRPQNYWLFFSELAGGSARGSLLACGGLPSSWGSELRCKSIELNILHRFLVIAA